MNVGFQSKGFKVYSTDGHNFILLEDIQYMSRLGVLYILPAGATSDGASVPQVAWNILPPFGSYWKAAYLHDCAYRNTLLLADKSVANLTFEQSNDLLKEAMEVDGETEDITIFNIYEGVALGGRVAFDGDRAAGAASYMADITTLT